MRVALLCVRAHFMAPHAHQRKPMLGRTRAFPVLLRQRRACPERSRMGSLIYSFESPTRDPSLPQDDHQSSILHPVNPTLMPMERNDGNGRVHPIMVALICVAAQFIAPSPTSRAARQGAMNCARTICDSREERIMRDKQRTRAQRDARRERHACRSLARSDARETAITFNPRRSRTCRSAGRGSSRPAHPPAGP